MSGSETEDFSGDGGWRRNEENPWEKKVYASIIFFHRELDKVEEVSTISTCVVLLIGLGLGPGSGPALYYLLKPNFQIYNTMNQIQNQL